MLPKNILMMLYNTLILPFLNYCILAWANCTNFNMNRLFRLQKKAIRIINHSEYLAPSMPIFLNLKLLNIYDMYNFQIAIFMYMCFKNVLPPSNLSHFKLTSTVHEHRTRNCNNFNLPCTRTSAFHKSIFVNGPQIWNNLPNHIRESPSLIVFKRRYKTFLLDRYTV